MKNYELALKAIAEMKTDGTTNFEELLTLCKAIARVALTAVITIDPIDENPELPKPPRHIHPDCYCNSLPDTTCDFCQGYRN